MSPVGGQIPRRRKWCEPHAMHGLLKLTEGDSSLGPGSLGEFSTPTPLLNLQPRSGRAEFSHHCESSLMWDTSDISSSRANDGGVRRHLPGWLKCHALSWPPMRAVARS